MAALMGQTVPCTMFEAQVGPPGISAVSELLLRSITANDPRVCDRQLRLSVPLLRKIINT